MTTVELFCASLLIKLPVVATLPPQEIYLRCMNFYAPCVAGKMIDDGSNQEHVSLESHLNQCAHERTEKDY